MPRQLAKDYDDLVNGRIPNEGASSNTLIGVGLSRDRLRKPDVSRFPCSAGIYSEFVSNAGLRRLYN